MPPTFTIAIPTYNNKDMLKRCIAAILPTTTLEETEIIVVNNGEPGLYDQLQNEGVNLGVGYIWNEGNIGVGPAYNVAFNDCRSPYFVTLNDDLIVKDPHWLVKMWMKFHGDPQMGAVGVKGGCSEINQEGLGCGSEQLEYVEGSCMMVRTEIVRQLPGGLFDPVYRFGYFEDSDLSLRLRKRGYHIALVDVEVEHTRAATTDRVSREGADIEGFSLYNQQVFCNRWGNYLRKREFGERVAIRRTGAIGDVLFLTPVLREIKKRNPATQITVYTGCPDVLEGNSDCDHIMDADAFNEDKNFDRIIDLDEAYERRPGKHIVGAYAEVCKLEVKDKRLFLDPGTEAREWASDRVVEKPYVVVHPHVGQPWLGRNPYPVPMERIIDHLRENWLVVLLGSAVNNLFDGIVDLRGKTTFRQACAVIQGASLFVGVDSALMNAAQAFNVPTVGIFGAVDPKTVLVSDRAVALTADPMKVGCLGCASVYGYKPRGGPGRCLRPTDICMEKITLYDAVKAIKKVLDGKH